MQFTLLIQIALLGDRTTYDRATLLSLANSPFSKAQPGRMAYVPGITKSASVPSGSYNKKSVEQKKEESHKKKSTCKWDREQERFFFIFICVDESIS
jgi:Eukaryotic translation initiation factor 4E binding protein (EIF4EBP)